MKKQNHTASLFLKVIFIASLLFLSPLSIKAQDTLIYANSEQFLEAGEFARCYADPSAALNFDQIKALPDSVFKKNERDVMSFGNTTASIWAKFPIQNQTKDPLHITFWGYYLSVADVYILDDLGVWTIRQGGTSRPYNNRDLETGRIDFKMGQNPRMVYLNLKSFASLISPVSVSSLTTLYNKSRQRDTFFGVYTGVLIAMALYNLFLFFSVRERLYLYYFAYILASIGLILEVFLGWGNSRGIRLPLQEVSVILAFVFSIRFLNTRQKMPIGHWVLLSFIGLQLVSILLNWVLIWQPFGSNFFQITTAASTPMLPILGLIAYWRGNKSALYYTIAWSVLIFCTILSILGQHGSIPATFLIRNILPIGMCLETILLAFALANRLKEYRDATEQAQDLAVLRLEENETLIREQNKNLEKKVHERTTELEASLETLKATQTQLIQSEKLASLGELIAGIAHEIQNPLNFVTNFSELSVDLVKDLKDEFKRPDKDEAYIDELFDDLGQNQEKINHHGKRASSIVKGMLEHSRPSTSVKELTDINALADECFRLSYQGLKTKDKGFNATMETILDKNLPKIDAIPQDLGRVLSNLFNNAFYAVNERSLQFSKGLKPLESSDDNYTPSVFLTTQLVDNQIIIKVKDNGLGMPESVRAKVFQPFFTTKPTGQGTGLGLSLAYDIVTKVHGGALEVISNAGVGSEFIIQLPLIFQVKNN
jgi:signal transduction histidine kinase